MIRKEIISNPNLNLRGTFETRLAVRGIVMQNNKYLMLFSERNGDFSFPGGGIESSESEHEALKREMLEECGVEVIAIASPIAETIEIDPSNKPDTDLFIRKNVYYPCRISEKRSELRLMPYEKDTQCTAVWVELEKAFTCNEIILNNTDPAPPRWTKRETIIMHELNKL